MRTHDRFGPILGVTVPPAAVLPPARFCADDECNTRIDSTTRIYCELHRIEREIATRDRSRGAFV